MGRGCSTVLVALVCTLTPAAKAAAQSPAPADGRLSVAASILVDFGISHAGIRQQLPEGWESRFQPPTPAMTTSESHHAYFADLGWGLEPRLRFGSTRVGVPIVGRIVGTSSPRAGQKGSNYQRFYSQRKLVSGVGVGWWNAVVAMGVAVRQTTPAVGVSLARGYFSGRLLLQPYSIVIEQFQGRDCAGCVNDSRLISAETVGHGVGERLEVFLHHTKGGTNGAGVFVERNGPSIYQAGVRVQVTLANFE